MTIIPEGPDHPDWIERIKAEILAGRNRPRSRRVAIRAELARKIKAAEGRGGPVSLTWGMARSILEELTR